MYRERRVYIKKRKSERIMYEKMKNIYEGFLLSSYDYKLNKVNFSGTI